MSEEQKTKQSAEEKKANDKELNFRALEAKYQRQLEAEQRERERIAREANEMREQLMQFQQQPEEDDDDDVDPYIDRKKFVKGLAKTKQELKKESQAEIKNAINEALAKERQEQWMRQNADFYDVMQHADELANRDPELAETILAMPEGFERQKLVYRNIKAMGLDQPEKPKESIQDKVDANRRSPYYQPSGVSSAPYGGQGDYSKAGQKAAYDRMLELKARMRLG